MFFGGLLEVFVVRVGCLVFVGEGGFFGVGEVHGALGGVFVEVGGFYGGVVLAW